ncbi:MAG: NADH-quinone oxidoreductase subunit C [Candidatus Marinimicrobia bacterium]|nr:NADH-quinone oxidoreductase subunit C [Candidatus Neomarinimicrobiota bacterium]
MNDPQNKLSLEQAFAKKIQNTFKSARVRVVRDKRVEVILSADLVPPYLAHAKNQHDFQHLTHISCVDWLEDGHFELVYILWSYSMNIQLIVKCRIPRHEPEFVSLRNIWDHAETYEREIHEMYGVTFAGNNRRGDFLLEDWDGPPPMRRDFDTVKYSEEKFKDRMDARQDAQNVRETITKRSGEEMPDFAKPYSLR